MMKKDLHVYVYQNQSHPGQIFKQISVQMLLYISLCKIQVRSLCSLQYMSGDFDNSPGFLLEEIRNGISLGWTNDEFEGEECVS